MHTSDAAQVGVVGWITPDTAVTANSVGKVTFAPVAMAVPACIEQLKKEHKDLDLIVGLSHTGARATAGQRCGSMPRMCMCLHAPACAGGVLFAACCC